MCESKIPGNSEGAGDGLHVEIGRALESVFLNVDRECITLWQFKNVHI